MRLKTPYGGEKQMRHASLMLDTGNGGLGTDDRDLGHEKTGREIRGEWRVALGNDGAAASALVYGSHLETSEMAVESVIERVDWLALQREAFVQDAI
jgi:hypothetical protein